MVGGDLEADAAGDTFAGFEDDVGVLAELFEGASGGFIAVGLGLVLLGVLSEFAGVGFAAVAVEAAGRFAYSLIEGEISI